MKNKTVIELVVVLVLVGFGLWTLKNNSAPSDTNTDANQVVDTSTNAGNTNAGAVAPISYTDALVKYKDSRIQLDTNCQANPNNVTYKNNSYIMIDNRSSADRAVKLGSTFSIKAWGFKIVKLSSANLPATWYLDCGNSQNVATVLIQK